MPQKKYGIKLFSFILFLFTPIIGSALPIDWQGKFGVDTTLITNFRKVAVANVDEACREGSPWVYIAPSAVLRGDRIVLLYTSPNSTGF